MIKKINATVVLNIFGSPIIGLPKICLIFKLPKFFRNIFKFYKKSVYLEKYCKSGSNSIHVKRKACVKCVFKSILKEKNIWADYLLKKCSVTTQREQGSKRKETLAYLLLFF